MLVKQLEIRDLLGSIDDQLKDAELQLQSQIDRYVENNISIACNSYASHCRLLYKSSA